VGEVYVPKKRDKRGNRFGFVKFKEVKSIEALNDRLGDVWMGSFKLKANLALFGRNGKREPSTQQRNGEDVVKKRVAPVAVSNEARVSAAKPFKDALLGTQNAVGFKDVTFLDAEVVPEMMSILKGSYVGRLKKGVEFRALQVKLWLAGLHSVRLTIMGGDLVLLSRSTWEDVGEPACKKEWWGGLLSDLRTWSPNRVCTTRDIWVSMVGIPPHAWGETNFRKLVVTYGEFLELDTETRNSTRFDVVKAKIRAPLGGKIDFVVNLMIQGAKYVVRIVEEGGGRVCDDGGVEDQLRRSVVGSSCASAGQASVRAELEGLDDGVSESDGSEQGQHVEHREEEVVTRSKGYNQVFGGVGDRRNDVSEGVMVIPSMGEKLMVTDDNNNMGVQGEVRGSVDERELNGCSYVEVEGRHVNPTSLVDKSPNHVDLSTGPGGLNSGPIVSSGAVIMGLEQELGQNCIVGLAGDPAPSRTNPTRKTLLMDNFDQLFKASRGKIGGDVSSNLSVSNTITSSEVHLPHSKLSKSNRIPTPFHPLLGPKCLRFAEAIHNSCQIRKIRRKGSVMSYLESQSQSEGGSMAVGEVDETGSVEREEEEQLPVEQHHNPQGLNLSVCLPFQVENVSESGLHKLLDEEAIKDVEGFIATQDSPLIQNLEAHKLLDNQQELGFNFDPKEALPVIRLVNLEGRDREKLKADLESNGLQ
jgi:hypothetical protein